MTTRPPILDALFDLAPSGKFDQWTSGPPPNPRWRRPIPAPAEALATLRARFTDRELLASGVVRTDRFGEMQLVPPLSQPEGVIQAFRAAPGEAAFQLLTSRGPLCGDVHPVFGALRDHPTVASVRADGMLLVTNWMTYVALMDRFGFAATLGLGLAELDPASWRDLDNLFRFGSAECRGDESLDSHTDPTNPVAPEVPEGREPPTSSELGAPLQLILMDRIRGQGDQQRWSHWLRSTAASCLRIRREIGLALAGIWVWQPEPGFSERFKFAFHTGDRGLVRGVISESLTSLIDVADIVEPADAQQCELPDFLSARNQLLEHLPGVPRHGQIPLSETADLTAAYDDAVRRELAEPLISWARQHHSPLLRAAAAQLADVTTLLLKISPRLQSLQADFGHPVEGNTDPLTSASFQSYLALLARFGQLCREICQCQKN